MVERVVWDHEAAGSKPVTRTKKAVFRWQPHICCGCFFVEQERYQREMNNHLYVEIQKVKGIGSLSINLPLEPDVYAITGINGIGKSTLLSCITPRLKRPISFSSISDILTNDSSIVYRINNEEERWKMTEDGWACDVSPCIKLRGFQEGSLTNGTRFFNISSFGFRYYKQLLNVNPSRLVPADSFVKENLGQILQNDQHYYSDLFRLDRSKAERYYKYKGVVYYLKIGDRFISQFELSTGEFLLINLLHLLNNLLVRTNNVEKLNLILIDEIELALHPSAIKRLTSFAKSISKQFNVAIYFSTHSLEIINNLPIENLFYLYRSKSDSIACETPCYPAYITRDIYAHSGYDVLILVEDDLAQNMVYRYIQKEHFDHNKRILVLPVGGYDNTLELHQNLLQEEVLQSPSHIISIIDGDAQQQVQLKRDQDGRWNSIPSDTILFLPVDSLEKYIKKELFDNKNYDLMRIIRDRLFKFESDPKWYESEYLKNIENKRQEEVAKGKPAKSDSEYFPNGKNLFGILSERYVSLGKTRKEFRELICNIIIEYLDASQFEKELGKSLSYVFKH